MLRIPRQILFLLVAESAYDSQIAKFGLEMTIFWVIETNFPKLAPLKNYR